eukprot:GHVP01031182.1.p1 GENE.GHVP01031182.1~~GHVP01031182.1.p1  ORF type:complete len:564 (-),score=85.90 GHVP01031182.1:803-2494(-)
MQSKEEMEKSLKSPLIESKEDSPMHTIRSTPSTREVINVDDYPNQKKSKFSFKELFYFVSVIISLLMSAVLSRLVMLKEEHKVKTAKIFILSIAIVTFILFFSLVYLILNLLPRIITSIFTLCWVPKIRFYRVVARLKAASPYFSASVALSLVTLLILTNDVLAPILTRIGIEDWKSTILSKQHLHDMGIRLYEISVLFVIIGCAEYLLQIIRESYYSRTYEQKITRNNRSAYFIRGLLFGLEKSSKDVYDLEIKKIGFELEKDDQLNLQNEKEARVLGRQIFRKIVPSERDYITVSDVSYLFQDESSELIELMGGKSTGRVNEKTTKKFVVDYYKKKIHLVKGIYYSDRIIEKLRMVVFVVVGLGISLLIGSTFANEIRNGLLSVGALSGFIIFAVSSMITKLFNSFLFIFVQHPFDCGDYITFNGEDLYIDVIEILTTETTTVKNHLYVYFDTSIFFQTKIINHTRSPMYIDSRKLTIENTSLDIINSFRKKLEEMALEDPYSFSGFVGIDNIEYEKHMVVLSLSIEFNDNIGDYDDACEKKRKVNELVKIALENSEIVLL